MSVTTPAEIRFLKGAALGVTVLLIALALSAFQRAKQITRFEELDVERINIVEADGTPRLILYNSTHTPAAILHGKEQPHPNRPPHAGMLYFNDEGTENGGELTFDQFDQDQVVSLGGARLRVWDQPYIPMGEVLERVQAARAQPEGAQRTAAMEEVNSWARDQGIFTQRVLVGMTADRTAMVELADSKRRPRLRLAVDSSGEGRLDFLSENGEVVRSLTATASDPFQWLEDVEGARALQWVRAQNERSLKQLMSDPRYEGNYTAALAIEQDKSRIPLGELRDGWIYNFWQDDQHVRGLWRRARLASYQTAEPQWEILLDVDALAQSEGKNWVYKGATCLPPSGTRCMISLSDGGKDAAVQREFDVGSRAFVANGFVLPEAKSTLTWRDENTLLVATEWGPGTLTASGYPFIVKAWPRGRSLSSAQEIHRGQQEDIGVVPERLDGADGEQLLVINEQDTFFTRRYWALDEKGKLTPITLPPKGVLDGLYQGQLIFDIRQDWNIGDTRFPSGALLSMPLKEITRPTPTVRLIMAPGPRDSIRDAAVTRSGLLVSSYSNVRGRASRFTFDGKQWHGERIALPDQGTVTVNTADERSNDAFILYQNFLQPPTLYSVDVAKARAASIKTLPPKFDSSPYVIKQLEATSRDGTKVPYFLVRGKRAASNGGTPTLLAAYGGFQVSMLPTYSGTVGKLWLEQGGAYAIANIRGGGEFGPAWHQAGLKTRRQVVYDDFIAVAEDLIRRKITSPQKLGIQGGSNGGLLMGVMLTQRPELFRAVAIRAPLLDMLRYHKLLAGASWVDEYGSPDVRQERAWLEQLSPYQNLVKRDDFPVPFIFTSTKDDRVHPGHARKYAAKMESLGLPYFYYENIEGGHSAAANLQQRAKRFALEYTYLAQRLIDEPANQSRAVH